MSETPDTAQSPESKDASGVPSGAAETRSTRSRVLLGVGIALIAISLGIVLYQTWPDLSYELGLVDETWPYTSAFGESVAKQPTEITLPKGNRIVIPVIGVDAPISGGDSETALSQGVYHHAETAEPGQGDNIALAGHRNRDVFALLYRLSPEDPVSVWWGGEEYTYRVTRIYEVDPDDSSVLAASDEEVLTLYTCLPRFLGNKRTVVEAAPAEPYPSTMP
jgi:LPXTG-site transpeptidase (sortase) family protein